MTLYILETDHLSLHQRGYQTLEEQLKMTMTSNQAERKLNSTSVPDES